MALQNYREIEAGGNDLNAGFQWEFQCAECDRRWQSPFKPYRMGQLNGLLTRFAGLLPRGLDRLSAGDLSGLGARRARDAALAEAKQLAAQLYQECPTCRQAVCADCLDAQYAVCLACARRQRPRDEQSGSAPAAAAKADGVVCPNCRQPHSGGRFCAACGYDMANTHKSCPGCGALAARQARFCTDCGHAF